MSHEKIIVIYNELGNTLPSDNFASRYGESLGKDAVDCFFGSTILLFVVLVCDSYDNTHHLAAVREAAPTI